MLTTFAKGSFILAGGPEAKWKITNFWKEKTHKQTIWST
jgi:hypothetical protein